jgi:hypothetical protein
MKFNAIVCNIKTITEDNKNTFMCDVLDVKTCHYANGKFYHAQGISQLTQQESHLWSDEVDFNIIEDKEVDND